MQTNKKYKAVGKPNRISFLKKVGALMVSCYLLSLSTAAMEKDASPLVAGNHKQTDAVRVLECLKSLPTHQGEPSHAFSLAKPVMFDKEGMIKRPVPFIDLKNRDPMYVALGIWRACQEYEFSKLISEKKYEFKFFLKLVFHPEITYSNHSFSENDFSLITKAITTNPYFTTLDLYNCTVFDISLNSKGGYRPLGNREIKPFLKILHLTTLKLRKTDVNVFQNFVTHPSLTWLELIQSKVNDEGVKMLCLNSRIKHLNLAENPDITEAGITYVARMETLEDLTVRGNRLTDGSAGKFIRMPCLKTLDLSYNEGISDEFAEVFLSYFHKDIPLKALNVRHTSVSQDNQEIINITFSHKEAVAKRKKGK